MAVGSITGVLPARPTSDPYVQLMIESLAVPWSGPFALVSGYSTLKAHLG